MIRICQKCGIDFNGKPGAALCPDCVQKQKEITLRPRECRSCGITFMGGPRAWYCPECRAVRKKEQHTAYRRRKSAGKIRKIGSQDICAVCGKPYTVQSGLQQYCPDCAPEAVHAIKKKQALEWQKKNVTPEQRRERRAASAAQIPCKICGKLFTPRNKALTCSPECSAENAKRLMKQEKYRKKKSEYWSVWYKKMLNSMTPEELEAYRKKKRVEGRNNYWKKKNSEKQSNQSD